MIQERKALASDFTMPLQSNPQLALDFAFHLFKDIAFEGEKSHQRLNSSDQMVVLGR